MAAVRMVATCLQNASDGFVLFDVEGSPKGEIPLPGLGSVVAIDAQPDDGEVRFVFASFTEPQRAMTYRLMAEAVRPRRFRPETEEAAEEQRDHDRDGERETPDYETTQVWYPSRDGTRVSMFLVHRRDLPRDRKRPVLLSGYGGCNNTRPAPLRPGDFPLLAPRRGRPPCAPPGGATDSAGSRPAPRPRPRHGGSPDTRP